MQHSESGTHLLNSVIYIGEVLPRLKIPDIHIVVLIKIEMPFSGLFGSAHINISNT